MVTLTINGRLVEVDADPSTPLLWALRDNLGLTGTKFGCGVASCGACTVHLNGQPTRSCVLPISAAVGAQITTSEHIADDKIGKAVLAAWIKHDVAQCGRNAGPGAKASVCMQAKRGRKNAAGGYRRDRENQR
ncbi:(2Fe-2S)-binding protein [Ralstonia pseudosolanacearum]|uniref:(2Fe-2S)-binding protein n=1 Tax=Ralstonia pseudosolanacearum TaxID=1310165 RepID=UPI003D17B695